MELYSKVVAATGAPPVKTTISWEMFCFHHFLSRRQTNLLLKTVSPSLSSMEDVVKTRSDHHTISISMEKSNQVSTCCSWGFEIGKWCGVVVRQNLTAFKQLFTLFFPDFLIPQVKERGWGNCWGGWVGKGAGGRQRGALDCCITPRFNPRQPHSLTHARMPKTFSNPREAHDLGPAWPYFASVLGLRTVSSIWVAQLHQ